MNKYHARRTYVEAIGRWFDSKREAEAALALWARQQAGEIYHLRFQVPYDLVVEDEKVCRYVADFVWREDAPLVVESKYLTAYGGRLELDGWREVVADAKGVRTPVYKLKAKLMKAIHGITIQEV